MINKHIATSLTSFHYNHPKIIQIQIQLSKTSPQPNFLANKQSNKKLLPKTKLQLASKFELVENSMSLKQ